jgi:hypothetical protein
MGAENSKGIVKAIRWPLLVLAVAGLGTGVAVALDRTAAREWAHRDRRQVGEAGAAPDRVLVATRNHWSNAIYLTRACGRSPACCGPPA